MRQSRNIIHKGGGVEKKKKDRIENGNAAGAGVVGG